MVHGLSCSEAWGNLPGPGIEPVSPALASKLFTTEPPGKHAGSLIAAYKLLVAARGI